MESRDPITHHESAPLVADLSHLAERERHVLDELARAQGGRIGFQALRRRLGLHPQALTRTLRHLEEDGYIQRDELGYSLNRPLTSSDVPALVERVPVFAAILPTHLQPAGIVEQLRQRWFHGLRWFGVSESPNESVLLWTTENDGRFVRLRISENALGVELEGSDSADLSSVAPLMQALAVLYGKGAQSSAGLIGPAQ